MVPSAAMAGEEWIQSLVGKDHFLVPSSARASVDNTRKRRIKITKITVIGARFFICSSRSIPDLQVNNSRHYRIAQSHGKVKGCPLDCHQALAWGKHCSFRISCLRGYGLVPCYVTT